MTLIVFIIITLILIYVMASWNNKNERVYKYIMTEASLLYDKISPYSFKSVRAKAKELGQDYTPKQYTIQVVIFAVAGIGISYLYFYNLIISIIYGIIAIAFVPYIAYLRCKRIYNEFIFEQIQVYTTNTIMEFATTQSFVKALEGVYQSGVLEDPVKSDVKMMIDLAYQNGTVAQSISYMENKYDYYIVKNMHQLFLQITNEGSKDSARALENMSLDIDMLVEGVYRDKIDRAAFYKKFLQFGIMLYLMVMLVQVLLGAATYIEMLKIWYMQVLLHAIIIINTFFLINGTKYYNENVGAE